MFCRPCGAFGGSIRQTKGPIQLDGPQTKTADRRTRIVRKLTLQATEIVMKIMLASLAAATLFAAAPALAQEGPVFEAGPVWDFSDVQTKDGHFDDYMAWLDTGWKAQEEALMKAGVI